MLSVLLQHPVQFGLLSCSWKPFRTSTWLADYRFSGSGTAIEQAEQKNCDG
jgi:hypothetical protein